MKLFKKLLITIFIFSLVISPAKQNSEEPILRVLSYNIFHGATMKGDFDLDLIASVIKNQNPDLVALQEVDYKTKRSQRMDLALELAKRTDMIPLFGKAMDVHGGEYGEALLSKYTFKKTENHALPYTEGKEPRAALQAIMELQDGSKISIIGTHLDHTRDAKNRIMQAKAVNKIVENCDMPTILAGDLNAEPKSKPIEILKEKWTRAFEKDLPTYPSDNPTHKIDYIMYRPQQDWKVINSKVIDEKVASDHCPILVELKLLND